MREPFSGNAWYFNQYRQTEATYTFGTESCTYWKTKIMFIASTIADNPQIIIFWNTPFLEK